MTLNCHKMCNFKLKPVNLILSFIIYCTFIHLYAQDDSIFNQLYAEGHYQTIIDSVNSYSQSSNVPLSFSNQIIFGNACLGLEATDRTGNVLRGLSDLLIKASEEDKIKYQLLLARLNVKTEKLLMADSIFQIVSKNGIRQSNHALNFMIYVYYGLFKYQLGELEEADSILQKALAQNPESNSALKAKVFNTLAFINLEQSKGKIASEYFDKAAEIWAQIKYYTHPQYVHFLNDFALFQLVQGDLISADSLLTLSENINRATYQLNLLNGYQAASRAALSTNLGDFEEAIIQYEKAIGYFERLGNTRETAISLFNLADIQFIMGMDDEAEANLFQALELSNRYFGSEENLLTAKIMQSLAYLKSSAYQDSVADEYFKHALRIIQTKIGSRNLTFARTVNNYAHWKENIGELGTALQLYQEVEKLDTVLLSLKHPEYNTTLYNLARCFSKMDSIQKTISYYRKANRLQLDLLHNYFSSFDEDTRLSYRLAAMGNFDVFLSYACSRNDPQLNIEIQNINLATKNLALDYTILNQKKLTSDSSDLAELKYREWLDLKQQLTESYLTSSADRQENDFTIDSLENEVNRREKEITRLFGLNRIMNLSFDDLKQKLKPNEVCIDFFNYYVTDEYGRFPDSILYYASITKRDFINPQLVFIGDQKALQEILEASSHYTLNNSVNQILFETIWRPLEPYLEDVDRIYLSPEGLLHQVSFATLGSQQDSLCLIDKYKLNYYSNVRDFILDKELTSKYTSAYLIADPQFGMVDEGQPVNFFQQLPHTAKEVRNIGNLLHQKEIKIQIDTGSQAIEKAFYDHTKSEPSIIHIATHGFFFVRDTTITDAQSLGEQIRSHENSLLRSGLVLGGANITWNQKTAWERTADGIISAMEIAQMDLDSTSLVVLSACETGRGAIADGEGVFGLQRAFKKAGVKHLLISLWKVPDASTSFLMQQFYRLLLADYPPDEAIMAAQQATRNIYPSAYDWGAFVLFN